MHRDLPGGRDHRDRAGSTRRRHHGPGGEDGTMARVVHPIEQQSYEILRARVDTSALPPWTRAVVERVIHASADLGYLDDLVCAEADLAAGAQALRDGAPPVATGSDEGAAAAAAAILHAPLYGDPLDESAAPAPAAPRSTNLDPAAPPSASPDPTAPRSTNLDPAAPPRASPDPTSPR